MIATIRRKGELTIPAEALRAVHLEEGDEVDVEVIEDGIVLRRREGDDPDDRDPWYYGTPAWEEGLDRALAEADSGTGTIYESGEEFLAALEQWSKDADLRNKRRVQAPISRLDSSAADRIQGCGRDIGCRSPIGCHPTGAARKALPAPRRGLGVDLGRRWKGTLSGRFTEPSR
jgi:antitoxin PrlF